MAWVAVQKATASGYKRLKLTKFSAKGLTPEEQDVLKEKLADKVFNMLTNFDPEQSETHTLGFECHQAVPLQRLKRIQEMASKKQANLQLVVSMPARVVVDKKQVIYGTEKHNMRWKVDGGYNMNGAKIRKLPKAESHVLGFLRNGDVITEVARKGGWIMHKMANKTRGWTMMAYMGTQLLHPVGKHPIPPPKVAFGGGPRLDYVSSNSRTQESDKERRLKQEIQRLKRENQSLKNKKRPTSNQAGAQRPRTVQRTPTKLKRPNTTRQATTSRTAGRVQRPTNQQSRRIANGTPSRANVRSARSTNHLTMPKRERNSTRPNSGHLLPRTPSSSSRKSSGASLSSARQRGVRGSSAQKTIPRTGAASTGRDRIPSSATPSRDRRTQSSAVGGKGRGIVGKRPQESSISTATKRKRSTISSKSSKPQPPLKRVVIPMKKGTKGKVKKLKNELKVLKVQKVMQKEAKLGAKADGRGDRRPQKPVGSGRSSNGVHMKKNIPPQYRRDAPEKPWNLAEAPKEPPPKKKKMQPLLLDDLLDD
mmetsp:Transcript_34688/g.83932  ORF Transcript_34688/g.83932 Transcript_34688/m.83932 type:complete len:536 (-) Transcript_34688:78-1685(-)|eukprot:CAMPEP_0114498764 /NCGR_PEP_ID=MMETSP0109-20121206/7050_1 /TAXON_ID=29199 /ORGANISM="Chlorarachnion reptans, Strain CCCM449" /LENGTH=535 /DNA_ID=CAMNT_0001676271 /DNA_START=28 /DNA_END=1635 /DNA_ORIENTATION=-